MLYFTTRRSRSGRCAMTILSSDHARIMLGLSSNRLSIGESTSGTFLLKSWALSFRSRRSIWWGWRVTLLAPRIGNDVSYVMRIKDAIYFAWQEKYLMSLKGDFTCSAHCKCNSFATQFTDDIDFCSRRSFWMVPLVAPRIANDVSK